MGVRENNIEQLKENGFCVLKNIFKKDDIAKLKKKFAKCEKEVHEICRDVKPDPYEYVQQFEKESRVQIRSYLDATVLETAKGTVLNITYFTLINLNRYLGIYNIDLDNRISFVILNIFALFNDFLKWSNSELQKVIKYGKNIEERRK